MLVLRQDDGQALAPPVRIDFRKPVKRVILQEDEFAVTAGSHSGNLCLGAAAIVRFCKAPEQGNPARPACEYRVQAFAIILQSRSLPALCRLFAACCDALQALTVC